MSPSSLTPPFPYFGGKASVAATVWRALGDVKHYIEPFFGSGAVLLARPDYDGERHIETVCDADGHICNVWRALQAEPDAVARVCDHPVNHADLIARKKRLNERTETLLAKLCADDRYYDVETAGYWIWASSCWIGSGLICPNQRPHLGGGMGVHKLSMRGKRPHLGGKGVHKPSTRSRPDETADVQEPYAPKLYEWFRRLSERLRYVRVVCGDWSRVCGGDWQSLFGTVGIFFDPPYSDVATRDSNLYSTDSLTVAHDVREWCRARGSRRDHRIVLAGYYEEHESLLADGWTVHRWSAAGGYGRPGKGKSHGATNRHREALFMSPHCVGAELELPLFGE